MKSVVETIYDAQTGACDIPMLTETFGTFDIPKAYEYQAELIKRYLDEGRKIVGYKMGLTSREKMEQMGVLSPVHGVLFEDMQILDGKIDFARLIHPKVEPEIAVRFKNDVPLDADKDEIIHSIGEIAPAIDVIDSRFKDFKFTMADVVADNCSSAQFVTGEWISFKPDEIAMDQIQAKLFVNDKAAGTGVSSAVLGNPLTAIDMLHKSLAEEGIMLKAGQIVLSGAITAATQISAGDKVINKTDLIGNVEIF